MAPTPADPLSDPLRAQRSLAERARAKRGLLRQWAEVRGVVGGIRAPHEDVRLRTVDGVTIAASMLPGPCPDAPAVVLGHGLAAHRHKPAYALLADLLAAHVHVLAIDHRGHGDSDGVCSFGRDERHDVDAAVRWLGDRDLGPVVPVGCSMGGIAVMHALADGTPADAAVVVSVPARHVNQGTAGLEELDRVLHSSWRRRGWQWTAGFRIEPPEDWDLPADPVDLVADTTQPLLVVHGEDDPYFPVDEAPDLVAAAGGPAVLWREAAGFGHAEDGVVPGWAGRLAHAISAVARTGRFPEAEHQPAET